MVKNYFIGRVIHQNLSIQGVNYKEIHRSTRNSPCLLVLCMSLYFHIFLFEHISKQCRNSQVDRKVRQGTKIRFQQLLSKSDCRKPMNYQKADLHRFAYFAICIYAMVAKYRLWMLTLTNTYANETQRQQRQSQKRFKSDRFSWFSRFLFGSHREHHKSKQNIG